MPRKAYRSGMSGPTLPPGSGPPHDLPPPRRPTVAEQGAFEKALFSRMVKNSRNEVEILLMDRCVGA